MRVAISGAHCSGKSTLIDAFLLGHDDYVHEPEAYEALVGLRGEAFAAEPSSDDYFRQLEYHVDRLHHYSPGDRVIFERTPADYLAYLQALGDLRRDSFDAHLVERALDITRDTIACFDLIVYLPASGGYHSLPDGEDGGLRDAVNTRLERILIDDDLRIFAANRPSVLEATGATARRLRVLETAIR